MVKIGNYHIKAFRISIYFFLIFIALILIVNILLHLLFHYPGPLFSSSFILHIVFFLGVSIILYYILAKEFIVKKKFLDLIREEEKKYQILFENANDAILLIKDEFIIDCNLKSCEIFNCEKYDLIGKSFLKLSSESKNVEMLVELIKKSSTKPQHFEWSYSRNANEHFDAEVSLNQVDLSGFLFIQVFIKDISALKESQMAFNESEEKFKMIFNSVSDGILIFTEDHNILEVNNSILKQYNLSKEEFKQMPHNHPNYLINTINKYLPELNDHDTTTFEIENIEMPNRSIPLEMKIKKIEYDGQIGYIAVGRDISQRKLNQKAVYNAVIQAEEVERSRVAKELHDGISPILSAAKLYAQALRDCNNEELKSIIISKIESTINDSIQSLSEISNNLSPHILQNFGLTAAVESFMEKNTILTSTKIQMYSDWNGRLEENIEVTIYRVIIELINNSLKYAEAENITILIHKNSVIQLTYTDNGKGFDINETLARKKGMGLFNIINRVKSLNGTIDYFSKPGEGFKVIVKFQLHEI